MEIDEENGANAYAGRLLEHAERQTKALENINWVLMALFVMGLIGATLWVFVTFAS